MALSGSNPHETGLDTYMPHCHMTYALAILGSIDGMYPASLDLHATCPLYQCLSLEDLDRYLLCDVVCL